MRVFYFTFIVKKLNTIYSAGIARILTFVCDIIVMYICYIVAHSLIPDAFAAVNPNTHLMILIAAYAVLAAAFPPLSLKRGVSGEQVISRNLLTALGHFCICAGMYAVAQVWMGDRPYILTFWCIFAFMLTLEHLLLRCVMRYLWGKGKYTSQAILIGDAKGLEPLAAAMKCPKSGYQIKGVFTNDGIGQLPEGIAHLGTTANVADYLTAHPETEVVFCQPESLGHEQVAELFNLCVRHKIDFYDIPEFMHALQRRMETRNVGSTILVSAISEPISHWPNKVIKRTTDMALSILCLCTIFPILYIIVVIFTKRQSPGPVFAKKKFEGQNGKTYTGIYFRTKHTDTEQEESTFSFGTFLHRTHLDELPLLFSILKGQMSFAGPRYHACPNMETYHQNTDDYQVCKLVKPGLSGCGSACTANDATNDIAYVQNWSIWLDAKLILQMMTNTLKKKI